MNFKKMNIENVHISTARKEIRKNFEEKWVGEDELLELLYLILKIDRTEDKRSEKNLLEYLESRVLLESNLYQDHNSNKFKLTEKGLDLLLEFYTMIYRGNPSFKGEA